MATELQKRALEKVVEIGRTKKRLIKGRILVEAGYSPKTAIDPGKVFESKGFLQLADELGLTEELLTSALVKDIKEKPRNRKGELELGFKIRGLFVERNINTNLNIPVPIYAGKSVQNDNGNRKAVRDDKEDS